MPVIGVAHRPHGPLPSRVLDRDHRRTQRDTVHVHDVLRQGRPAVGDTEGLAVLLGPPPGPAVCVVANRNIMTTMAENIERATRPQLQELVQLLVERVQAKERVIDPATIEWTPPARPFFGKVRGYGAPGRFWGRSANVLNRRCRCARDGVVGGLTLQPATPAP